MRSRGSPQWRLPGVLGVALVLASVPTACADRGSEAVEGRASEPAAEQREEVRRVRPGAEVLLADSLHLVRGRRAGLVTNQTGVVPAAADPDGAVDIPDEVPVDARAEAPLGGGTRTRSTIDVLSAHPEVRLVALFAPEHSIRGDAEPGEEVQDEVDPRSGLPIHSLYGETRKPTPEMLEGLDVLLFDVQDVGARYYTYVSTMALAMEAAGEAGIPFVVLDRPNPIDGVHVQGNVLDPAFASFVGMFPIPMRHGMTPGELARLVRGEFGVEATLHVVPAEGWRPGARYAATDLPWIPPSPNIPSVESALHYVGTCLFEGTGLSVGRGTERPFQQVGAPWLDGVELARRLNERAPDGVRFEPVRFTPVDPGDGKYDGVEVSGVRFVETGPDYDPTRAAVLALVEARRSGGERWEWRPAHFDRLAGTDDLRRGIEEGLDVGALTASWEESLRRFRALREPYLIYPRPEPR